MGALLMIIGLALASGAGWARWTAIALITLNLFEQLGWLGNTAYPLWTLTAITVGFLALYGLTVRWGDNQPGATSA
jgi:hypothetical protein